MGYSKDFKERAVEYRLEGHTVAETSKIFGIGTNTLNRWLRQYKETGDLSKVKLRDGYIRVYDIDDTEKIVDIVNPLDKGIPKTLAISNQKCYTING